LVDDGTAAEKGVVFKRILQHLDFQPGNMIYRAKEKTLVILDWEYARYDGAPLVDLFNFLFSCAVCRKHKRVRLLKYFPLGDIFQRGIDVNVFEYVFYEKNIYSGMVADQISAYCQQVGISNNCARLLFLNFIVQHLDFNQEFLKKFLYDSQPLFLQQYNQCNQGLGDSKLTHQAG
jgi:hypothetical protein